MIYTLSDELRDEGYAQGLADGIENIRKELVQNMLQYGMTPEIIAEATKLSINQVQEIQAAEAK